MEEEPLAGVLQSLLVSVERAIERVPIDDLAFPCPECHEYLLEADCDGKVASPGNADKCGCSCACQQTVQKRDTCIQTSPMFEYVGTIPHIDSDDDDDLDKSKRRNSRIIDGNITTKLTESAATQTLPRRKEVVMPQSIADLPDKLLMAGVFLPGIHDAAGRAVVLCDMPTLFRAGVNYHKVATLLLYYSSLPRPDRLKDGFTILAVSSSTGEQVALLVLDKAMALLLDRVKFHKVLLWRQTQSSNHKDHRHEIRSNLERSKVQCEIVGENELRQYISDDQLPVTCGGRANHDQLEWVEFRKELEPFLIQCHGCGRRLATAMTDLRNSENQTQTSRRQLHHQHRILSRAVNDQELQRLRREGAKTLSRIEERAQWLPASEDVRMSVDRARRLFQEVDRAAKRLEQLSEGRREKLKDLARLRAIEDETSQVLSWLCKKGEETLKRHTELATNLPGIKVQEQDFEKFYFISMRHLDKGNDLLEEAGQCSVGDTRSSTPGAGNSGGSALRDLARSLKHHLRGFSDRLEDTRERLEDTSRCFYLLDKAYEWALETMKYMSRIKIEDTATAEQTLHMLKQLQQYLMAHPAITEEHFTEMWQLAKKLGNEKLLDQCKVAHSRCQETMEMIRTQQSRLTDLRQQLVDEDLDYLEYPSLTTPTSPKPQHHNWNQSSFVSSTPVQSGTGRRRSVGSFPYIYKCSHHAAGHSCSCYDPTPSSTVLEESRDCHCSRLNNLDNIQEVRESAEDLLDVDSDVNKARGDSVCERCSAQNSITNRIHSKRNLQRSCTWQYPTESFDEDGDCSSRLCDELNDGRKCDYSTDTSGDNTTEGSEGFPKSADDLDDQEGNCGSKCIPPVPVNSHLHCHPSSLDLHSPSGDRDAKTQKTLLLIMREMIQTERDYVKSLDYIIENYIPQLLREDIPQALRGQRNVIFGNVEKIYEFHSQYFLQELERCENRPLQVGKCFLRHENKFYLYALYNKNKPKSDALMSEYGTLFFKTKQLELGDKMDLASYLLKPVQRMGKYALLLQQLMKAYPEKDKDGDIGELKAAEKMVRFQLRHGNDLLAMDSLRDCDVNVKEQGRLLRQNEFLVWQGKGKKCLRHVFLFEELILFSKARRFPDRKNLDLYIYKNSIKMTDIGLTAKVGDSTTKFEIWFRKRKPNDTFTLQSMSEDVKKSWTEEISKLLWKQAMRNREMRMAEMSSMGIGNKPCLDIRPSADQISDRSISIAQLSKTAPRFRNSITVTAGELQRSNKRPHSIISVSSSSSGGSSGSQSSGSGSGCGTLNLGFDSHESPHLPHRSTTLHSQGSVESGIIADMSLSSEDTEGSGPHWHVERSNSSATSISLESSMSPTSPMSPSEEDKTCLTKIQDSYNSEADSEELSIKL